MHLLGWLVAAIAGAGLLTACTTPMFTMPPGPQDFRVGFHDGCDAGYAYAGSPFYRHSETTRPPASDEPYASGWQAGFAQCASSYQRIQRATSVLFGPP
jgi:hypothetical protein